MDLENKLRVAKEELEKAALDKVREEPVKPLSDFMLDIFQDCSPLRSSQEGV